MKQLHTFFFINIIILWSWGVCKNDMNIADVIRWDINTNEFVHKFESDSLRLGSQLVVYPCQTALFVKGGVIADEFPSGTYTIKSENIPILGKLINIPFNNETPFKAEVWFINQISKLDLAWGTPQPIQIEDPKYNIIVPIRAHGQYGIRISQPRLFLESLIGNMNTFRQEQIEHYFKGRIITNLNTILTQQILDKKVSVLDINTQLVSLSEDCNNLLNIQLQKYGISITDFSIMSITVPQDDESVIKLKNAKDIAARLNITGRDVYQMERSFDILEKAAANEGVGGQMIGMGVGLGAGVGVGTAIGNIAGQMINTTPPPLPSQNIKNYHLYINGTQMPNQSLQQIEEYVINGEVTHETLVWTIGMTEWVKISDIPELCCLLNSIIPPPIK